MATQGVRRRALAPRLLAVVAVSGIVAGLCGAPASAGVTSAPVAGVGSYELTNGFWRITGEGAAAEVASDPTGDGAYAASPVGALRVSGAALDGEAAWERSDNALTVHAHAGGADRSFTTDPARQDPAIYAVNSDPVQPGHSLGQTFTATAGVLSRIDIPVYTYGAAGAVVGRAVLRHDGPTGEIVAQRDNINVQDGVYVSFSGLSLPRGTYYAELANSNKPVAWPKTAPGYTGGQGYADGAPAPAVDRWLRVAQRDAGLPVALTYALDGPRLKLSYVVEPPAGGTVADPGIELDSPWRMSGYGLAALDGVGISRFVSDSGQYLGAAQFKRDNDRIMQDYYAIRAAQQLRIDGTGATDLRVERAGLVARWSMNENTLTTRISPEPAPPAAATPVTGGITLRAVAHDSGEELGDQFPEFVAADSQLAHDMTSLFRERGFSFTGGTFTELRDWMGLERDWTANNLAKDERAQLLADRLDASGYVWSWPTQQGWPWLPSPAALLEANSGQKAPADFSSYDSRHFTTNSNFLLGSAHWWASTHDTDFLAKQLPRARAALDYLLRPAPTGLAGQDGLIVTDVAHDLIRNHEGAPGPASAGSNWWDGLPYGNLDAYANLYFFQALEAAAQLEEAGADPARAAALRTLHEKVKQRFTETFWDETAGRFVQTVAKDGTRWDFGSVYLNLEAVAAGLTTPAQSQRIWSWLDKPTDSGKADTFSRWAFAPRSDTKLNDTWWDWVFLYYFGNNGDFDGQVEDGGSAIYLAYYDVLARLRSTGVDDAYTRFAQTIDRYRKPDHLAGGSPLYFGEIQQHLFPGQVATDTPFPEAGLAAGSFLQGFLGIQPNAGALNIDPHLPQRATTVNQSLYPKAVTGEQLRGTLTYAALPWAGIRHLAYRGALFDVMENYRAGSVHDVSLDVTARNAVAWPLTVTVTGVGPDAVVQGAAGRWDGEHQLWTLTITTPGHVTVARIDTASSTVPGAPYAVLLPLCAIGVTAVRRHIPRGSSRTDS